MVSGIGAFPSPEADFQNPSPAMASCSWRSAAFFVMPPADTGFAIFSANFISMAAGRIERPIVQSLWSRLFRGTFDFGGPTGSSGSAVESPAISPSLGFRSPRNRPRAAFSPAVWRNLTRVFTRL